MKKLMYNIIFGLIFAMALPSFSSAQQQSIKLTTNNAVVIRGPINGPSMVQAQLDLANLVIRRALKDYPIYVVFDSPGGSVTAGKSFIAFAKTISNLHTITLFSASMAAIAVQTLPGKRYVTEDGSFMFHRAKASFSGQFEDGELESELFFWKKQMRTIESKVSTRIKIPLKDYKQKIINEWWLDAEDAIRQNVADEIVELTCSVALVNKRSSVSIMTIFGNYKLEFSGCPLFQYPLPKEN